MGELNKREREVEGIIFLKILCKEIMSRKKLCLLLVKIVL